MVKLVQSGVRSPLESRIPEQRVTMVFTPPHGGRQLCVLHLHSAFKFPEATDEVGGITSAAGS
jgi:hypothetical protein